MSQTTYRILVLGDFHFGESYGRAGARILADKGYEHSLKYLRPFAEEADHFIVNLEAPTVDPQKHPSPLRGKKTYIHWADPVRSPIELKKAGVDAVSLANNHTVDHGVEGLLSTFKYLSEVGIPWFGAGETLKEAKKPYVISLPELVGGGEIQFHGSFQYSKSHDESFGFYAKADTPGCASLSRAALKNRDILEGAEQAFHIAFPHWGANYKWSGIGQRNLSALLLEQGHNLILGHGSHCIQELEHTDNRWVAYGIGNGNFQSGGRFKKYVDENGILPMGAWAMLHVDLKGTGDRRIHLRLYPVYSDNNETDFQPKPVSETDFRNAISTLRKASLDSGRFDNSYRDFGRDELGWYIRVELGEWPVGGRPANLAGDGETTPLESKSANRKPGDKKLMPGIYDDPDSLFVRKQQSELGRNVAPLLISRVAEKQGATTKWIADRVAIIRHGDRRVLLQGHRGGESSLGKKIIGDKYLAKRFLLNAGVSTPRGALADSSEAAIDLQKQYGTPIVVKPRFGLKGRGVSVNLTSPVEITEAFERANSIRGGVIVEEYIERDDEYRCLTTPDECVSVVRRILPNVTGDGQSTLLELIHQKNEQRKLNPSTFGRPTPIDRVTESYLHRNGLSYDYVPADREHLTVRDVGGLSSGGEPHECSDVVDERVKQSATEAASAIPGLSWGGVDVLTSRSTGKPYVIEVNSDADIAGASFPLYGMPAPVAEGLWDIRFKTATRDAVGTPVQPTIWKYPRQLSELLPTVWHEQDSIQFRIFLISLLESMGYEIYRESHKVVRAVTPKGEELLLAEGETSKDLAVVSEVVKRHRIVRRLLRIAEVPSTRQANIRKWEGFQKFLERQDEEELALIPFGGAWGGAQMRHYQTPSEVDKSFFNNTATWIVQARPAGARLMILATSESGFAVLGESREAKPGTTIEAAVGAAVQGIRTVPGLRWAFVSVIVDESNVALVEGITRNPNLSRDSYLLAGHLEDFSSPMIG